MSSFHLIVIILLLSSTTISHTIILKENMMMNVVGLRFSLLSFACCMPNRICASTAHMAKNMFVLPPTPTKYKKNISIKY